MLKCRSMWRKLAPLTRASSTLCRQNARRAVLNHERRPALVPQAPMSSGTPQPSGDNKLYMVLVGATFVGGALYAYRTIKGDKDRYQERLDEIASRSSKDAPEQPATYLRTESPVEQAAETPQEPAEQVSEPLEAESEAPLPSEEESLQPSPPAPEELHPSETPELSPGSHYI